MNQGAWVDPRVQRLRAADVRAYLLAHDRKPQPYPGPELWVFAGPPDDEGEPIIQVVPSSEQFRDFRLRVEELIGALSVLEDRPAGDILTDMLPASAATSPGAPGQRDGANSPPSRDHVP
jgi:hypothetical protein